MVRRISNQKGSTLLEATLSIMLLGFGLTGGIFLMQNATRASLTTDFQVAASQLANERLEIIIADKALNPAEYDYVIEANYPAESLPSGTIQSFYTRTVDITEVSSADLTTPQANSGTKKVEVTVNWNATDDGSTQEVKLSTLLTEY